jgi:hypothetical protein
MLRELKDTEQRSNVGGRLVLIEMMRVIKEEPRPLKIIKTVFPD